MLPNVGWGEFLIIAVVALVVLGPERLPEAMRWVAKQLKTVREFASKAQDQLKDDFGTDFEEIRKPLQEINQLRGLSPRGLVTKHLLDGDDSLFTGLADPMAPAPTAAGTGAVAPTGAGSHPAGTQGTHGTQGTLPGTRTGHGYGAQPAPGLQAGPGGAPGAPVQGPIGALPNYDDAT